MVRRGSFFCVRLIRGNGVCLAETISEEKHSPGTFPHSSLISKTKYVKQMSNNMRGGSYNIVAARSSGTTAIVIPLHLLTRKVCINIDNSITLLIN